MIVVSFLAFVAFLTVSFVVEVQAASNAMLVFEKSQEEDALRAPLLEETDLVKTPEKAFEINERVEISKSAEHFLGSSGQIAYAVAIIVYLFGDLAIYAVAVPVTMTAVSGPITISMGSVEWAFTEYNVYYLWWTCFVAFVGPLSFFNFQKTKYLQLSTMVLRNVAFWTMIVLGVIYVFEGNGTPVGELNWVDFHGLPSLFGAAVYAFMCHHSLPSILTPIENKSYITRMFVLDFIGILLSYFMLCGSAMLAFGNEVHEFCENKPGHPCQIQGLYTLNFASYDMRWVASFLSLFPVFTLTSNFPMIAITLRNNLMQLFPSILPNSSFRQSFFTICAIGPAFLISFLTRNVKVLVTLTGGYAGLFIMFVFPALMVHFSRKKIAATFGALAPKNIHTSPFTHPGWVWLVYVFSGMMLAFTIVEQIRTFVGGGGGGGGVE